MITFKGREIKKIAVVGSGQIGPDIALHFSKVFSPHGVDIVVLDVVEAALEKGQARVTKRIDRGVESGAFEPETARAMKEALKFTTSEGDVVGAALVVEAATERRDIKQGIFAAMESLTSRKTILASNSSHMAPEVIFDNLSHPERGLVTHYFFPADGNPIVEIIPGPQTAPGVVRWMMDLCRWMGKV